MADCRRETFASECLVAKAHRQQQSKPKQLVAQVTEWVVPIQQVAAVG